jgi:transcriptional regulator with XRE-family HTH domain
MKGEISPEVVGRALRTARENAGLLPANVARRSGLTPAELRRIERGESRPSIAVLQRLASAVGTNLLEVVRHADRREEPADGFARRRPFPDRVATPTTRPGIDVLARGILELPPTVGSKIEAVAAATVLQAMALCRNNQSAAARLLGMERKAFVRRLQRARRRRK